MQEPCDENLKKDIEKFLYSLQNKNNEFHFYPVLEGVTYYGKQLTLGFSCYVIKCFHMLDLWDSLDEGYKQKWLEYINSFQVDNKNLPSNSYLDPGMHHFYTSTTRKLSLKDNLKKLINLTSYSKKRTYKDLYLDSVRAETKQAIATLYEVGSFNKLQYKDFPNTKDEIDNYLDSLNWSRPWNAGAQFSALCVFTTTQLENNEAEHNANYLYKYLEKVLNKETGLYHKNIEVGLNEKINGTMKVITGLDWIEKPIHYPEKVIDFCLKVDPGSEGCDIVDLVYILYKSCKQSKYKTLEVQKYFEKVKLIIFSHYYSSKGGFSYSTNKSQDYYYGLKISKGLDTPDIHGTTLLLWALTMIYDINDIYGFKVIKP